MVMENSLGFRPVSRAFACCCQPQLLRHSALLQLQSPPAGCSGVTALAFRASKAKAGGEGNRTPVLIAFDADIYMFIRC